MKHLEVRQKYSAARRIFNSLLGVSSCDETQRLMLDILHKTHLASFLKTLPLNRTRPSNTVFFSAKSSKAALIKILRVQPLLFSGLLVLTYSVPRPKSKNR